MIISMRSTVVFDDNLYRKARERAAALNTTLSDVVNQALREALFKPKPRESRFEMVVFGDPSAVVSHEPQDFAEALSNDDAKGLGA